MEASSTGPETSSPNVELAGLLAEARSLAAEYATAVRSYIKTRQWADMIAGAFEVDELPDALFHDWELTDQYRQLEARFQRLYDRVVTFLRGVKGTSGRQLAGRVAEVPRAVQLSTQLGRLTRALTALQSEPLRVYDARRPPRMAARPNRRRSTGVETRSAGWTILGTVVGVLALSILLGILLLGVVRGLTAAGVVTVSAFVGLRLTEDTWAPWIVRGFSRSRR